MSRLRVALVLLALSPSAALAQGRGDAGASDAGPGDAGAAEGGVAVGPAPLAPIQPTYPPEALKAGVAGDVVLLLTVDEKGAVTDVEVQQGLPQGVTEAAVAAAKAARFRPARDAAGAPTPVRIRWVMHFELPEVRTPIAPEAPGPTPAPAAEEPLPANVEKFDAGRAGLYAVAIRQKGTGKRLPGATVFIEDRGEILRLDDQGRAERKLPPGAYAVTIRLPGHEQQQHIERIHPGQRLDRTYFLYRDRLNPYETIVRAPPPRAQTGVVTLEGDEIRKIPGTFGDPFRAVLLLPGVSSPVSGLAYPVVRGESPGATGTFIDGIRVPLLYHLAVGPAVVHPMFLESLDFHAGGFPAEFGRFTAGLIHARTTGVPEERQSIVEADLFKFSGFHTQPFRLGGTRGAVSAAGRFGTLTFLAQAFNPNAVLEYWDYQVRGDVRAGPGTARILFFGARDTLGTKSITDENGDVTGTDQLLQLGFHRADIRYRASKKRLAAELGIELGQDYTLGDEGQGGDPGTMPPERMGMQRIAIHTGGHEPGLKLNEYLVRPRLAVDAVASKSVKLRMGGDLLFQNWKNRLGPGEIGSSFFPPRAITLGGFAQAEWQPTDRWLIAPGVRVDHYRYHLTTGDVRQTGVDPRVAARYRLQPGLFVKGSAGLYHGPPRFLIAWPALEGFGLQLGLNESYQYSLGAEWELPWDATLDGQLYYNHLPRVTENTFEELAGTSGFAPTREGRSYGVELIARRRMGNRLFGWLTYSLARSERQFSAAGWRAADFDQTHIVNAVLSYALGRAWTISGTFHLNSGRPVTPPCWDPNGGGFVSPIGPGNPDLECFDRHTGQQVERGSLRNSDRLPQFWRVDARIEKREAFDTWFLDFYVDWFNISFQRETTAYTYVADPPYSKEQPRRRVERDAPLTIPTLGLKVVF